MKFTLHTANEGITKKIEARELEFGQVIGSWSQNEREVRRDGSDYYSRHRIAKGDLYEVETSRLAFSGSPELEPKLLAALGISPIGAMKGTGFTVDETGFFMALQEKARGFSYFLTKTAAKTPRGKEIAAGNKARAEAIYEIA
jgi:hypothetical protein